MSLLLRTSTNAKPAACVAHRLSEQPRAYVNHHDRSTEQPYGYCCMDFLLSLWCCRHLRVLSLSLSLPHVGKKKKKLIKKSGDAACIVVRTNYLFRNSAALLVPNTNHGCGMCISGEDAYHLSYQRRSELINALVL